MVLIVSIINLIRGKILPIDENSGINPDKLIDKFAFENSAYIDAEHKVNDNLSLSYGLRVKQFSKTWSRRNQ